MIGLVAVVSAAATIAMLVTAGYPDSAPRLMWIFTAVTAVMTAIATLLAIVTQTRNDGKK
ncbi:hypothetical protein A5678_11260 [Mycobacterium sp. E2733]|nr:hypothetical protein A5678_11260 [Mycobacterium sp. E2733]